MNKIIEKIESTKIKNLFSVKDDVKKMRSQMLGKKFASDKVLLSNIY